MSILKTCNNFSKLYTFFEQPPTRQKLMKLFSKKTASLIVTTFVFGLLFAPVTLAAVECDGDGDGYIVISNSLMKEIADVPYDENGNYSPAQWSDFFNLYKKGELTEDEECIASNFKKGAEPSRCDATVVDDNGKVYDSSKVTGPLRGTEVNPGAFDTPGDGIDQDCNGSDGELLANAPGGDKNLEDLDNKVVTLLSRLVVAVSIVIMIWGGVMYSSAAGNERKTSKARKAIIGAVIGLIVGLLAPTIVNLVVDSLA